MTSAAPMTIMSNNATPESSPHHKFMRSNKRAAGERLDKIFSFIGSLASAFLAVRKAPAGNYAKSLPPGSN
jgi:hypothetical protein